MRTKNSKLVCILLAMLVLLSGLYSDYSKTDSLLAYAFVEKTNTQILSHNVATSAVALCTAEMLGNSKTAGMQQLVSRYIKQKCEIKVSLSFLCADIYSVPDIKIYTSSTVIHFHNQYSEELITRYIEKSDGKKRI